MLPKLIDIGLTEKEARVYLAALEIGRATADQLAKHAKIVRSTTYVQLESLMQKGLMSTYEEGKKTYFAPESPELLKRLLLKQQDELSTKERDLSSLLPDLIRQFEGAGERPVVRFFPGKEGIDAMRESFLTLPKETQIRLIYSFDALERLYSEDEMIAYAQKRSSRGIKIQALYTRKAGPMLSSDIVPHTIRRFIPQEKMPIHSDIYIYNHFVAVMALQKNIFGVIIESEEIAQTLGVFFDLLWQIGEDEK